MVIKFEELRLVKDLLPSGSTRRIAEKLGLSEQVVRNYFGGRNFRNGAFVDMHIETGPEGTLVRIDDLTILREALRILDEIGLREEVPIVLPEEVAS